MDTNIVYNIFRLPMVKLESFNHDVRPTTYRIALCIYYYIYSQAYKMVHVRACLCNVSPVRAALCFTASNGIKRPFLTNVYSMLVYMCINLANEAM